MSYDHIEIIYLRGEYVKVSKYRCNSARRFAFLSLFVNILFKYGFGPVRVYSKDKFVVKSSRVTWSDMKLCQSKA